MMTFGDLKGTVILVPIGIWAAAAMLWQPGRVSADDDGPPETIELTGSVRDFIERTNPGGHPDFERVPSLGFGIYNNNISETLGDDHKPVFTGDGWKNLSQWSDSEGNSICYLLYDPDLGDEAGNAGGESTGGISSNASFNQWFNDSPGVNLTGQVTITLIRQSDGSYVFDDKVDPLYASKGGFFPIDNQLFGNSGGSPNHNYHFTFELHTHFTYHANTGQMFAFIGDDDVWVFIDGRLVIDLGGVHGAREQIVELDRLNLESGQIYPLDFFFAERHREKSNCRIQTNLVLHSGNVPNVTSAFD